MLHVTHLNTPNTQAARLTLPNAPINSAFPNLAKQLTTARKPSAKPIHPNQAAGTPMTLPKPVSMELIPNAHLSYVMGTQLSSTALRNIALLILLAMDASLMLMRSVSTRKYALLPRVKVTLIVLNTPSARIAPPNLVRSNAGTQRAKPVNANMETNLSAIKLFVRVILKQRPWVNIGKIVMLKNQ